MPQQVNFTCALGQSGEFDTELGGTLSRVRRLVGDEYFRHTTWAGVGSAAILRRKVDADIKHIKCLTNLTWLSLVNTDVTDAGLAHLKGLTKLQTLGLDLTQVTDAGLVHLKGLTNLRNLALQRTQVTDSGVKKLQKALPNCDILH